MEDLQNNEARDIKEKVLNSFFENLSEDTTDVVHIERQEIERLIEQGVSVEDICHEFVRRGFLLHGTDAMLDVIEPKHARDEDGHPENLKNAVYATVDSRIPLFMSLIRGINGHAHYSITTDIENDIETEFVLFATSFQIPVDKIGYVHVLPSDTFEVSGSSDQFTSAVPVSTRFVLPVVPSDFPYPIEKIEE